ncbi:MAG: hypothetical protein ACREX3_24145 [Gammaproteobacteria bacterium]
MFGNDETYYAYAAEEIGSGQVRRGLWAKALADSGYDEQLARARYLKLRVKALKAEVAAADRLVREQERAMQRQAEEQAKLEKRRTRSNLLVLRKRWAIEVCYVIVSLWVSLWLAGWVFVILKSLAEGL